MKVQATVLLAFQAKSLAEAGAVLDDVLVRARDRDDVDVGRVELLSPPGDRAVTLPPVSAPLGYQPHAPPPGERRKRLVAIADRARWLVDRRRAARAPSGSLIAQAKSPTQTGLTPACDDEFGLDQPFNPHLQLGRTRGKWLGERVARAVVAHDLGRRKGSDDLWRPHVEHDRDRRRVDRTMRPHDGLGGLAERSDGPAGWRLRRSRRRC
jgi:hypothetical protein